MNRAATITMYSYDKCGLMTREINAAGAIEWLYTYDASGNILTEYRDGGGSAHGLDRYNLEHTYDALNRLIKTTGDRGYVTHTYQYDSLGNLVFEKNGNGAKKGNEVQQPQPTGTETG